GLYLLRDVGSAVYLPATLTRLSWKGVASDAPLLDDLGDDAADAGASQADRAGSARGQVEYPAADEWAAVVDCDDDAAVATRDPELGAERQGTGGRRPGVLCATLAGGGPC